jgi:vacuolar iron transporter family protein
LNIDARVQILKQPRPENLLASVEIIAKRAAAEYHEPSDCAAITVRINYATTPHVEHHFMGSESVRDVVIGMADGLTVPFALAAGLTAAVNSTHVIVTAGLAEVAAGAIAMGLGGYLAVRSDQEHYASEERREYEETVKLRDVELEEVATIFRGYGLAGATLDQVTSAIAADQKRWVDFMMRFELGLERPDPRRAPMSAFTIAISYVAGGFLHNPILG